METAMSEETENKEDETEGGADDPVKKLSAKVDEILGEKKKLAAKVREYEAAEAERKAEIAKREEEEARKKGDFEKLLQSEQAKLKEKDSEAAQWRDRYFVRELDLNLTQALDAANVKPELRKAAMALLRNEASIDEDGRVTISDKPLADYMKEWAKSDDGKAFIANGSAGGGANGGGKGNDPGSKNPWEPGANFSLTEQGQIYKTNKALAIQLAAAHGIRLS
jgi:type I site-specific restriction-modification system R (restriction) subunit